MEEPKWTKCKYFEYDVESIDKILDTIIHHVKERIFDRVPIEVSDIHLLTGMGGLELINKDRARGLSPTIHPIHMPQFDVTRMCGTQFPGTYYPLTSYIFDAYVCGYHLARFKPKPILELPAEKKVDLELTKPMSQV